MATAEVGVKRCDSPPVPSRSDATFPLMVPTEALSSSQVNAAGRVLRHWYRSLKAGEQCEDMARVHESIRIVLRFRAAHQYPLTKATMGVRSVVKTEHCAVEVSQRLKRLTTIIDKLGREPSLGLATVQDVGGCRALLENVPDLRRVERRLRKNRPPLRDSDYILRPRSSGYRAVHVVVQYPDRGGALRAIEVQLRTKSMHEWAIAVERLSGQEHADLKSGQGPPDVLAFFEAASEAMALEEAGAPVPQQLSDHVTALRVAALHSLERAPAP